MLQIYLYGPTESGFLELDPGTVLDMEEVSEIFDEALLVGEYSLPGECPWSDNNRRLMGYTERIQNFVKKDNFWRVDVYDGGICDIQNGKLTLLEKSGDLGYRRGRFNFSISGAKGMYSSAIKNKKLTDLTLGGPITYTGPSRIFATDHAKGLYPQYDQIGFAPVAMQDFFDTQRSDYNNEFLVKETANAIVTTGSGANDWQFGREDPGVPNTIIPPGNGYYTDFRTIPFYRMKYVLRKCFEEFGYSISGDFIDNSDFDDLFLYNNYSIEQYAITLWLDFNQQIIPRDHVPDMLIREFIQRLCGAFNMYVKFKSGSKCELVYRTKTLKDRRIYKITPHVNPSFSTTPAAVDNEKGYELAYAFESGDAYVGDRVKELTEKTLVGTVVRKVDLDTLAPGFPLTTDHVALVEAENLYYVVADATVFPVLWEVYSERLQEYKSGNFEKRVDIPVSTLCQYVVLNTVSGLYERKPYLACRQMGSYYANNGIRVKNSFDLRMFYIQKIAVGSNIIPCSFNHSTDPEDNRLVKYSLSQWGLDGLAFNFYHDWLQFQQQAEITKITMAMDRRINNDLNNATLLELMNVYFIPQKRERQIPMGTSVTIDMIAL